jgi:hypothetical protein
MDLTGFEPLIPARAPKGNVRRERRCKRIRVNMSISDARVCGMAKEIIIEMITKMQPQRVLDKYAARLLSLEHTNPPKNADTNRETYPIGEISDSGSGKDMAIAVATRSNNKLIPMVINTPKSAELMMASNLL